MSPALLRNACVARARLVCHFFYDANYYSRKHTQQEEVQAITWTVQDRHQNPEVLSLVAEWMCMYSRA